MNKKEWQKRKKQIFQRQLGYAKQGFQEIPTKWIMSREEVEAWLHFDVYKWDKKCKDKEVEK